jgi:hypothetical protein
MPQTYNKVLTVNYDVKIHNGYKISALSCVTETVKETKAIPVTGRGGHRVEIC